MNRITLTLIISVLLACGAQSLDKKRKTNSEQSNNTLDEYWYQGKAELNRFELNQARYGELRKGDAIMVFVTEDFLLDKQVKKESNTSEESISILKLNHITKFNTGIYDYSMMSSVFSPLNSLMPLKTTFSAQEWCGHTWLQLNNKNEKFSVNGSSYFEKEADQSFEMSKLLAEDGLWNLIRINPDQIEEGEFVYLPSSAYLRLMHKEIKGYQAIINKETYKKEDMPGDMLMSLNIEYPELNRTVQIIYESESPYRIAGWKETRKSGYGPNAKNLTTTARRTHQIVEPYWNLNSNSDDNYRGLLGLD